MSLRFTSANLDFVRGHDAEYLAHLCADADVLLVQEAKDIVLADVLPEGWRALQDVTSEATRGSAICYREATVIAGRLDLTLGARPSIAGRRVRMLTRSIASAHLWERTEQGRGAWYFGVAGHFPPKRFGVLQPGMARRLRRRIKGHPYAVIGLDANQPLDRLAKWLGLSSYGVGIVGLIYGRRLRVTETHADRWGIEHNYTDHPSICATVSHKEKP